MAAITLVGTALAVVLLVVVVMGLSRGIEWRSNELMPSEGLGPWVRWAAGSPFVWLVGFLSLALGTLGLALAAVGGFGLSLPGGVGLAAAPFALMVLAFLVGGTYAAVRDRNVSPAGATLAASLVVATLLLVAVAGRLLMGP